MGGKPSRGRWRHGDHIEKPKWMRWATFDREMEKVEASEAVVDGHLWMLVQKFNGRLGRD
jgi:hypothetical protein